MTLSKEQEARYHRQIILKNIVGKKGQEKLLKAKILIIGQGGLGSPISLYLAAAGVGTLGIMDGDKVDISNLQRQIIHTTTDIGKEKVDSAKDKINALNPEINVIRHNRPFSQDRSMAIIKDYDFIIDATDNFAAKFLINDTCVMAKKPYSHAGILNVSGQTMTIIPYETACYRCVFLNPPPENEITPPSESGVLGSVAGVIGTIQATEAIKFILNQGELLTNRLLTFEALTLKFKEIPTKRNSQCSICGS